MTVAAIRSIRESRRQATGASGFGSRITPGLPGPTTPDPLAAPVLLQVGSTVHALDPVSHTAVELSPATLAVIEGLLEGATRPAADGRQARGAIDELFRGGIAQRWCDDALGSWSP